MQDENYFPDGVCERKFMRNTPGIYNDFKLTPNILHSMIIHSRKMRIEFSIYPRNDIERSEERKGEGRISECYGKIKLCLQNIAKK